MKSPSMPAILGFVALLGAPLIAFAECVSATLQPGDTVCISGIENNSATACVTSDAIVRFTVTDQTDTGYFLLVDTKTTSSCASWDSGSSPSLFQPNGGFFQACAHRPSNHTTPANINLCFDGT